MSQVFLTVLDTNPVIINDLGSANFPITTSNLPLIIPNGEFDSEDIASSTDLITQENLGNISLINTEGQSINTVNDLNDATNIPIKASSNESVAAVNDAKFITPFTLNFTREVTLIRVLTNDGSDNTINYNNAADQRIQFNGSITQKGSDFTWNAANDWILPNFDGWVRAIYNVPIFSAGTRNSLELKLILENVAGDSFNEASYSFGYIRNSSGHDNDNYIGYYVYEVSQNEKIYINAQRAPGSTNNGASNITQTANLIVERIK